MIKSRAILKKANITLGKGAIICSSNNLSAIDSETLIIPIWAI